MLQQNLRARAPPFHDRDLVFCESYRRAACLTPPTVTGSLARLIGADGLSTKLHVIAQAGIAEARIAS